MVAITFDSLLFSFIGGIQGRHGAVAGFLFFFFQFTPDVLGASLDITHFQMPFSVFDTVVVKPSMNRIPVAFPGEAQSMPESYLNMYI
jgi:hypothetical protein